MSRYIFGRCAFQCRIASSPKGPREGVVISLLPPLPGCRSFGTGLLGELAAVGARVLPLELGILRDVEEVELRPGGRRAHPPRPGGRNRRRCGTLAEHRELAEAGNDAARLLQPGIGIRSAPTKEE